MTCTIFRNIFDREPNYISIDAALLRIKKGKSKDMVADIRQQVDKERANKLKCNLPSVCFSGKFSERTDAGLIEHSGYLVLDFDGIENIQERQRQICVYDYVYACWVSPGGNGLKALIRIADGTKHREHFTALREIFADADKSGINESRVCYESYDPEIYINQNASKFTRFTKSEVVTISKRLEDEVETFENILKWLSNRGDAFQKGERNVFIYKLASACCRFGMNESDCRNLCRVRFSTNDNSFSDNECERTIKSAYKSNASNYGSAEFSRDILVDKKTRSEIKEEINDDFHNPDIRPKDVIYGEDVKDKAINIYRNGYESLLSMGISELDEYWKMKKGEITLITGIGNYGKSSWLKFILLMRVILYGEKYALFSPEDNPAEEFYHDLVEIYAGTNYTPGNYSRPSQDDYERAYDYVSKHIFYVYPKDLSPTPEYIKERFLELIIKEKVDGCIIDPFNQMTNEYGKSGGRSDKYLETLISDFHRFAQINGQFFLIVAHPHKMQKDSSGNYPCPDVFDIADGAMWNNKMDNILVYHRPNHQQDPTSSICQIHTKKIRRQKTVGKKGVLDFELNRGKRRYLFGGIDPMEHALRKSPEIRKLSLYEEMQTLTGEPDIF